MGGFVLFGGVELPLWGLWRCVNFYIRLSSPFRRIVYIKSGATIGVNPRRSFRRHCLRKSSRNGSKLTCWDMSFVFLYVNEFLLFLRIEFFIIRMNHIIIIRWSNINKHWIRDTCIKPLITSDRFFWSDTLSRDAVVCLTQLLYL